MITLGLQVTDDERAHVLRFLSAWRNWVRDGAKPRHMVFNRCRGLCVSAIYASIHTDAPNGLRRWLETMLDRDHGGHAYPFNYRGTSTHQQEITGKCTHTNAARLAWVDSMLRESHVDTVYDCWGTSGAIERHVDPFPRTLGS